MGRPPAALRVESELENETDPDRAKECRSGLARTVEVHLEVWRQFNRPGYLGAPVDFHAVFFVERSVDRLAVEVADADPVVFVVTDACKRETSCE